MPARTLRSLALIQILLTLVVWIAAASRAHAEMRAERFERAGLNALVYSPDQSGSRLPLVVWLHGASLRGGDVERVRAYGLPQIIEQRPSADFVMVAPHLPRSDAAWPPQRVLAVIDEIMATRSIDPERIYLVGGSLGAAGVWATAAARPGAFAGALVIASPGGRRLTALAPVIGALPSWFFHGDADRTVPLAQGQAMAAALRAQGAPVEFTIAPGVGHDPMTEEVFVRSDALAWLLAQRRAAQPLAYEAPSAEAAGPIAAPIAAWIAALTRFPHRIPGSPEGQAAEAWVEAEFRRIAPEADIGRDVFSVERFDLETFGLVINGRAVAAHFVPFSGFTPEGGVTAPLVFAGHGAASDFRRLDARGRIVVVDGRFEPFRTTGRPRGAQHVFDPLGHAERGMYALRYPSNMLGALAPQTGLAGSIMGRRDAQANAQAAGALGLITLLEGSCSPYASQYLPYDGGTKGLAALYVSPGESGFVRDAARRGAIATATLVGAAEQAQTSNVWAVLPGRSQDTLLITSHHDSPHRGAVEDASGMAFLLAQLQRWALVPQHERPLTLVFVAAGAHFAKGMGAAKFAEFHPDLVRRARGLVTIEHLAAREARPDGDRFALTGMPQASVIYVDARATGDRIAQALRAAPQPSLSIMPAPFGLPLSDAGGLVFTAREQGVQLRFASWISAPCYLIDEADTEAMLDPSRYPATHASVSAIVDAFIAP